MNVSVTWFSILREQAGRGEETVEVEGGTAADLYGMLKERHRLTLGIASLRVAVNDAFAGWDTALSPGDHVVFIAPVGGG
jgi:molybdopterin synthase sulfur carrier subunit